MKALLYTARSSFFLLYWLNVIKNLDDKGYEIILVSEGTINTDSLNLKNKLTQVDITISRDTYNPYQLSKEILQLVKISKKYSPSIIHAFHIKSSIILSIGSFFLKSINFFHITGLGFIGTRSDFKARLLLKVIGLNFLLSTKLRKGKIIVETDYLKNYFHNYFRIDENKIEVINGVGIDTELFRPAKVREEEEIKFIMVSRLLTEKGVMEYVAAANIISAIYQNTKFTLVGFRDEEGTSSITNADFNLINNSSLRYIEQSKDLSGLLRENHVFVLPSHHEGLSVASMEAAASGLCLLLSDIPGCRELVVNNHNGYTFSPKNVDSLVEAILKVINNKQLLIKFGENSRELILDNFSKDKVMNKLNKLYNPIDEI